MRIAIVLVHYHTPELLAAAFEALESAAKADGLELEGVVVDNGSRPEDREILQNGPFRCLVPGSNLGYAGGANLGIRSTSAELVVIMNPDVLVLPGCLAGLVASLESGAWAAGPRFFWDEDRVFLLPPTEKVGRWPALLSILADRSSFLARWARASWRRHARLHWRATRELTSWDLSGALLAVRREAWRRNGPMDEGYRLYFEETDWLQRLSQKGLESRYVPSAEAIHLYAQSTAREGRAGAWFQASSRRFRKRFYGTAFDVLARKIAGGTASPSLPLASATVPCLPESDVWVEVSSGPRGFPAAGRPPGRNTPGDSLFPSHLEQRLAPGRYFVRKVSEASKEGTLKIFDHARRKEPGSD